MLSQARRETIALRGELVMVQLGLGAVSPTARELREAADSIGRARLMLDIDYMLAGYIHICRAADALYGVAGRRWLRPWTRERAHRVACQLEGIAQGVKEESYAH